MLFYHLSTAFFAVAFAIAAPTRLENPKLLPSAPALGFNSTLTRPYLSPSLSDPRSPRPRPASSRAQTLST